MATSSFKNTKTSIDTTESHKNKYPRAIIAKYSHQVERPKNEEYPVPGNKGL